MFGMFSRRKPEAQTAPQERIVSEARIDRALRRDRVDAAPSPGAPDAVAVQPTGASAIHDDPLSRLAQDGASDRVYSPESGPVEAGQVADQSAMAAEQSVATVSALAPRLADEETDFVATSPAHARLATGFRTSWSGARSVYASSGSGGGAALARPVEAPAALATAGVDRVLVPHQAFQAFSRAAGDYDLVRAVVTFVDTMLTEGLYTRAELPPRTLQLYHADRYLSAVNVGGHRRLVHAAGGSLARLLADARTAFAAIGADAALDALNRFTDWLAENPDEAARPVPIHDAPVGVPEDLDGMIQQAAMADTVARAAAWISGWDDLMVVDDVDYPETLRRRALSNPLREPRLLHRSIRNIQRQLDDAVLAATGMACAAAPEPEIRLAVEGPVTAEVDGARRSAFLLRTNGSVQRLCILDETGASLHEQAPTQPTDLDGLSEIEDMEQALATGFLPEAQLPRTGRRLSHVGRDTLDRAMQLAEERHAAAAIDLLLRRAELEPENAAAAPAVIEQHPDGVTVTFLVAAQATAFFVASTPKGAVLVRPGDMRTLFTVVAGDIAAHAAKAAQGAPRPPR